MNDTSKVELRGVRWHALQRRLAESFGAAPAKACATGSGSWLERAWGRMPPMPEVVTRTAA
jgi:hypothetical protein